MAPPDPQQPRSRRQAAPGTSTPAPHRQRARKGEGQKLRSEILDAAEQLLGQKGSPDAISMRAIAEAVGVSPPAIYLHFDDKDELFFECCARRFLQMAEVLATAASGQPDPVAKLRAIGRAYIEFGLSRGEQYEVMMLGPVPDNVAGIDAVDMPGGQALTLTAEIVGEGVAGGVFRTDIDPLATAVALWAAVHGTVIVLLNKRKQQVKLFDDEAAVVEHALDIMTRGVAAY